MFLLLIQIKSVKLTFKSSSNSQNDLFSPFQLKPLSKNFDFFFKKIFFYIDTKCLFCKC